MDLSCLHSCCNGRGHIRPQIVFMLRPLGQELHWVAGVAASPSSGIVLSYISEQDRWMLTFGTRWCAVWWMLSDSLRKASLQLALTMEDVAFSDKSVNATKQHDVTSRKTVGLRTDVHTLNFTVEIMCTEFKNSFYVDVFNNSDSRLIVRYVQIVWTSS